MADASATNPGAVSRRELLKWASAGAGAAAVAGGTWLIGRDDAPSPDRSVLAPDDTRSPNGSTASTAEPSTPTGAPASASEALVANGDLSSRLLVVVEMAGGNDGLSMVVPSATGAYYDLRPRTAIAAENVLAIDSEVGYPSAMANLHRRGATIVQGVGSHQPDESHFEMLARWWNGDPNRSDAFSTGFLGRLADAIGDPAAAAVAVSASGGNTPALLSKKVATMGLSSLAAAGYLAGASEDDENLRAFQRGLRAFGDAPSGDGYVGRIRGAFHQATAFAGTVLGEESDNGLREGYPDSELTRGLSLAATLFLAGNGVRIVHVPMHGNFDTHDNHVDQHRELMAALDEALEAFLRDMEAVGLADRVLVMTTSEFGRRARDNGSNGLDHGTASDALLVGPVNVGRYGEMPSLTDLTDDQVTATVGMDTYYATVAESWFGVPAGEVLPQGARPLDGIINQ